MGNKRLKVSENNNNYNNEIDSKRDSFSDRICDDLCEVLMSYLSLEDKISFECVSKQFQRCFYNKQNAIYIGLIDKDSLNQLRVNDSINIKAFESILKSENLLTK
jgi:hypothetical protein